MTHARLYCLSYSLAADSTDTYRKSCHCWASVSLAGLSLRVWPPKDSHYTTDDPLMDTTY